MQANTEQIVLPELCCEHCSHPRHPQFVGHLTPCWPCTIDAIVADVKAWRDAI